MSAPTTLRSEQLRIATQTAHSDAEHSPFMDKLLSGAHGIAGVKALTHELYHVYTALAETAHILRARGQLLEILDPRLDSAADRLAHDLTTLNHPLTTPLPTTATYVDAIMASAAHPAAFLGHHYTRYLGDLSGGQIIRTMLCRTLEITPDALTFYDFSHAGGLGKLKPYKDTYKKALDALDFDADGDKLLFDAATSAFRHNLALFTALEDTLL